MRNKEILKNNFIKKAKIVHINENLDYSQVNYINNRTPVKIIDHDLRPDGTEYGEFWQTPSNHLKGQCHPNKRGMRISKSKLYKNSEIIKRFKEVHKNENLDYSQVNYKGMNIKVKIISHDLRPDGTEYGEFWQEPAAHLRGCTHPEIGKQKQIISQTKTTEEFINDAKKVHNEDDYDYSCVNYINNRTKVDIICNKIGGNNKKHGIFSITPDNFLQGKGCPICGNHKSISENELINFIENECNCAVIKNEHSILNGKELDIYIPDKKIAIEYNGLRWHSEKFNKDKYYHIRKSELCKKQDIKLVHIYEDDFLNNKECFFKNIKYLLNNDAIQLNNEECIIKSISKEDAMKFNKKYNIQGYINSSINIGAVYSNNIVAMVSFFKENNGEWKIVRITKHYDYNIKDIIPKIIQYFIESNNVSYIKTFIDRCWEDKNIINDIAKCDFKEVEIIKPDYKYTNGHNKRLHKSKFRREVLLKKYPNNDLSKNMTEKEMAEKLGYYRIWNCGNIKFEYNK